jgi:hypothetical protein
MCVPAHREKSKWTRQSKKSPWLSTVPAAESG